MGDSVSATMPETITRRCQRERELAEERAGEPALDADWRIHGRERDRHGDDRSDELPRRLYRGLERSLPVVQVPLHVLHHHNRIVDHETDREDDGEQREQVDRESRHEHQEDRADERDRNRDDRNDQGAHRSEEQKDHDDHD